VEVRSRVTNSAPDKFGGYSMSIVPTVAMEKDKHKMRVNVEDVAKYVAQGWKATGGGPPIKIETIKEVK